MEHLGKRLGRFLREKRGDLTQREFARKIGLAPSTVHRLENAHENVTIRTLERLCRAFRCQVGDLFPPLK